MYSACDVFWYPSQGVYKADYPHSIQLPRAGVVLQDGKMLFHYQSKMLEFGTPTEHKNVENYQEI